MPTITLYRYWCPTCKDWTLFLHESIIGYAGQASCRDCNNPLQEILLSEIPEDKIKEQRMRYTESKRKQFTDLTYLNIFSSFSSPFPPHKIVESDAGQKEIDRRNVEAHMKELAKQEEIQKELKKKYGHLGRNDLCGCGSGKKFKHCHLREIKHT